MNIEVDYGRTVIKEAYNGVIIRTNHGKELYVCLRDYGFDIRIDSGEVLHINSEEDLCCFTCKRKKKLENLDGI